MEMNDYDYEERVDRARKIVYDFPDDAVDFLVYRGPHFGTLSIIGLTSNSIQLRCAIHRRIIGSSVIMKDLSHLIITLAVLTRPVHQPSRSGVPNAVLCISYE